jgi:hypothetical protein
MDLRTTLAALLGVGIGLVLLAYPDAVIRAQTAGRIPHDRGGEYGAETASPARWRRLVRLLGVVTLLFGLYFGGRVVSTLLTGI